MDRTSFQATRTGASRPCTSAVPRRCVRDGSTTVSDSRAARCPPPDRERWSSTNEAAPRQYGDRNGALVSSAAVIGCGHDPVRQNHLHVLFAEEGNVRGSALPLRAAGREFLRPGG